MAYSNKAGSLAHFCLNCALSPGTSGRIQHIMLVREVTGRKAKDNKILCIATQPLSVDKWKNTKQDESTPICAVGMM